MSSRKLRNAILAIFGLILTLAGFAAGRQTQPQNTVSPKSEIKISPTSSQSDGSFLVSRVIDGDTVELENGDKVRYIGIDTPETMDPRKPVQCFGKNATAANKELVEGKPVWLVKDITNKDKYGRLLRYVYLGDPDQESSVFVNLELVKQGFAHSSTYPPDIKYQDLFLVAQTEARENQRGLWGGCRDSNPDTIRK
jgi:micrococcal nuclease